MRPRLLLPLLAGLTVLLPVSTPAAQNRPTAAATPAAPTDTIAAARALVQKFYAPKVPGFSVAVAIDGRLVWSEGFGYADIAKQVPVGPATRFRIGSISKSLTSVGVALLVERGQLDLDAPVQTYVPTFPRKNGVITARLLGGHLAGIRHYRDGEILLDRPFADSRAGLTIFQDDPLVAPPGREYHYSTYGWTLLSAVMESAAKEDFIRFMDTQVIRPLGLAHTRADLKGALDPDRTQFYLGDAPDFRVAPPVDSSYKWAGGGYLSTPEDLVRFGSALLQPGFLTPTSLNLLFTPQKPPTASPLPMGSAG